MTNLLAQRGSARSDRPSDPLLQDLMRVEERRARETIPLVASASIGPPEMRALAGSVLGDLTTEGYPGARFHPGCQVFDRIEEIAIARAREAFGATFANVQPHSGSTANQAATAALAPPGSRVLAMDLKAGGHLSHGAQVSQTSRWFDFTHYDVEPDGLLDYEKVHEQARRDRPHVIICGASSYPRRLDFARFAAIARDVEAALIADISHVSGLVVTGEHPSPIPYADLVTTSTYKQLAGPRGGLVLGGAASAEPDNLRKRVDRAVFPGLQGTPNAASIAAKAWAFRHVTTPEFRDTAARIVKLAELMAHRLHHHGLHIVTGGTDTHMVLVDVAAGGWCGFGVEKALESAGILVNRNAIPHDSRPPGRPSGIRLGLNSLAQLGATEDQALQVADMIADVMASLHGPAAAQDRLNQQTRLRASQLMTCLWTNINHETIARNNR